MANKKNMSLGFVILLMISSIISCTHITEKTNNIKEYPFGNCVINIKMELPNGWTSEASGGWPSYAKEFYFYENAATWLDIKDNCKNNDDCFNILFHDPYFIGDKKIDQLPGIDEKTKVKCGDNYLYLIQTKNVGAVYVDKRLVMPFTISKWPKKGVSPDMVIFFASLNIN